MSILSIKTECEEGRHKILYLTEPFSSIGEDVCGAMICTSFEARLKHDVIPPYTGGSRFFRFIFYVPVRGHIVTRGKTRITGTRLD